MLETQARFTVMSPSIGPRPPERPALREAPPEHETTKVLGTIGARFLYARGATEEELITLLREADALLVGGAGDEYVTRRVIENLPSCKAIVRHGIGVDNIDVQAATEQGIVVANVPDFCIEEVANHAILLLLACAKKLTLLHNALRGGDWGRKLLPPMPTIHGQTLGLVGFGNIARSVARKAQSFQLRVIAYDPYTDQARAWELGVNLLRSDLPKLLRQSDYVSVHTPLNDNTRHLIGEAEFRAMKSTAFFINTARGAIVDEKALVRALQEHWIAGAGLDVFEQEPTDPSNPLLTMDNVTVTPHSASYADETFADLRTRVAEEAARVLMGEWPLCVVNPQVQPRVPLRRP